MKTITNWNDLVPYGIDALTGEACGLSYRIRCDVTARGRHIVQKCLGLPDLSLGAPWNTGGKEDPHVGSLMLPPEMLLPLGVFALLESGCREVWKIDEGLLGIEANDAAEDLEAIKRWHGGRVLRTFAYRGTAGDRNLNVFTGRVT